MGQVEVIELLSSNKVKKPLSTGEIAKLLNVESYSVSRWLSKLLKYDEIDFIEIDKEEAKKYNKKGRMRLYYISI